MPIKIDNDLGAVRDLVHGTDGFLGPTNHSTPLPVDLTQFTNKEIDANGYLKPYIPLKRDGTMVASGFVYGVTAAPIKVAEDNADATIAALDTIDVAVYLNACVKRAYAEDVLDRAYTTAERDGFDAAGSKSVLVY